MADEENWLVFEHQLWTGAFSLGGVKSADRDAWHKLNVSHGNKDHWTQHHHFPQLHWLWSHPLRNIPAAVFNQWLQTHFNFSAHTSSAPPEQKLSTAAEFSGKVCDFHDQLSPQPRLMCIHWEHGGLRGWCAAMHQWAFHGRWICFKNVQSARLHKIAILHTPAPQSSELDLCWP